MNLLTEFQERFYQEIQPSLTADKLVEIDSLAGFHNVPQRGREDGRLILVPRQAAVFNVIAVPTVVKEKNLSVDPVELLRGFFEQDPKIWTGASDRAIYTAALAVNRTLFPSRARIRSAVAFGDVVTQAVLARRGVSILRGSLPNLDADRLGEYESENARDYATALSAVPDADSFAAEIDQTLSLNGA